MRLKEYYKPYLSWTERTIFGKKDDTRVLIYVVKKKKKKKEQSLEKGLTTNFNGFFLGELVGKFAKKVAIFPLS